MKVALGFLLTASLGGACGALFAHFIGADVNSVILLCVAGLGAICNAGAFQIISRHKDILSAKSLNDWHQERMERRLKARLRKTLWKWFGCFLMALITAVAGGLLRLATLTAHHAGIAFAGYVAGVATLVLVSLVLWEFAAWTMLWNELRQAAQAEERDQDFLRKVKV